MTDNIFDRLSDLLRSQGPVNWRLAAELAASVAGQPEPVEPDVADELRELLRTAHLLVVDSAGLGHFPDLEVEVTDRRRFATEHVEDLSYLAQPVAVRLASVMGGAADPMAGMLTPALIGVSLGIGFGAAARQALGGFDFPLPLLGDDRMVLVLPNVEELAAETGLDPKETRMWCALREAAHATTVAIPWVRSHLLETVARYVEELDLDPAALQRRLEEFGDPETMQEALRDPETAQQLLGGAGNDEAASPLRSAARTIGSFARFVSAGPAQRYVSDLGPIERWLQSREAPGLALLGLGFDRQPDESDFFEELSRRWGSDAVARVWRGPESLPTEEELDDPVGWAARVLLD